MQGASTESRYDALPCAMRQNRGWICLSLARPPASTTPFSSSRSRCRPTWSSKEAGLRAVQRGLREAPSRSNQEAQNFALLLGRGPHTCGSSPSFSATMLTVSLIRVGAPTIAPVFFVSIGPQRSSVTVATRV